MSWPTLTWAAALKRKIEIPNTVDHRIDMILLLLFSIFDTKIFTTRTNFRLFKRQSVVFLVFALCAIHKNPRYAWNPFFIEGAADKFLTLRIRGGEFLRSPFTRITRKSRSACAYRHWPYTHTLHKCTTNTIQNKKKLFETLCVNLLFIFIIFFFLFGYTQIIVHMSLYIDRCIKCTTLMMISYRYRSV